MFAQSWACVLAACLLGVMGQEQNSPYYPFSDKKDTSEAYVTLLYGDRFLLGARVLGQSIKESGTSRDMVVMAAGSVSEYTTETLQKDGWKVHRVEAVQNPNMRDDGKYPARFWAVYTKLNVFNLIQYRKVIFIDADAIVVGNMDEVFQCPGFCATLRHSERFNSGVMAITPSKDTYADMISRITELQSYTGGDQGFLNAYYPRFIDSPLFDPAAEYNDSQHVSMLLPTRYNADIGLYVVNSNRWLLGGRLKVVHYTFGAFKPWDWWCGWLIEEQSRWNRFRMKLGADANGRRYGISGGQAFAQSYLPLLPAVLLALLARGVLRGWPQWLAPVTLAVPCALPANLPPAVPVLAGYGSLLGSIAAAYSIIPSAVTPSWGWILVYEYSICFFLLLFGKYLHIAWASGRGAYSAPDRGFGKEGRQPRPPWSATLLYGSVLLSLLIATPFIPTLLRVRAFAGRIVVTVAGGLVANTVVAMLFVALSELWLHGV